MAGEEGAQVGRPQRKKTGARVIYRECDSDDEDYETFALIRYLDSIQICNGRSMGMGIAYRIYRTNPHFKGKGNIRFSLSFGILGDILKFLKLKFRSYVGIIKR